MKNLVAAKFQIMGERALNADFFSPRLYGWLNLIMQHYPYETLELLAMM